MWPLLVSLAALTTAAWASPLAPRQNIDLGLVDSAPDPSTASIPIGATTQSVTYNLAKATEFATATPLLVEAVPLASKRDLDVRNACDPQPTGAGPIPDPDTASAFLAYASFSSIASSAPTPPGYEKTFTNLHGSSSAYGYMGLTTLDHYDPTECADKCNAISGCVGINIYFERDPSLEPGALCDNPPSTTVIKCTFWGGYVASENADNTGQWRNSFQVVIAGSNGYMSTSIPVVPGFSGTSLGANAINAPQDCNGVDTYMGSKIFTTSIFDPNLCAAACESQNSYNTAHPPSTGSPSLCKFFNTYLMAVNGRPQGQYCAMYTEPWDNAYATNSGQYRGSDHYTVGYSFSYSNISSPGIPVCPSDIAYLETAGAQFCTSYIGYSAPTTTTTALATAIATVISLTTVIDETTVTNYVTTTITASSMAPAKKRDVATPASISDWEAASISLACSQVADGTIAATITSTATVSTTLVSVIKTEETTTTTATVTSTATAPATTTNLVTNGDFETCQLGSWHIITDVKVGGVTAAAVTPPSGDVDGGNCCLELASSYYNPGYYGDTDMTIGQALNTVAGVTYHVSWDMSGGGGGSNYWQVAVNNEAPFASGATGGDGTWTTLTGTFVGTGSDTLIITAKSTTWGIGTWWYDNFVVKIAS